VHRVQDQLDADESEDRGQAVRQIDQAVQQPVDEEVRLSQPEQGVAVKTRKIFWVSPKMAGMESRANKTSVPAMATITSNIGVIARLASIVVNSLSPS
jgi:hypothetical protein